MNCSPEYLTHVNLYSEKTFPRKAFAQAEWYRDKWRLAPTDKSGFDTLYEMMRHFESLGG